MKQRFDLICPNTPDSIYLEITPKADVVEYSFLYSTGKGCAKYHSNTKKEFLYKLHSLLNVMVILRVKIDEVKSGFFTEVVKLVGNDIYSTASVSYIVDKDNNRFRITISDCTRSCSKLFDLNNLEDKGELWYQIDQWINRFITAIEYSLLLTGNDE